MPQNLAGRAARKVLKADEMHRLRPLVAGERVAAERIDFDIPERLVRAGQGIGDARGWVFQAPATGRFSPRFSRNVLPA